MKIERFNYLKEKGITDSIMFDIIKYRALPALDISFEAFVQNYGIKHKSLKYPLWEVYLNILMWEYQISKETVEKTVKSAIDSFIEEIENNLKKLLANYKGKNTSD